jgi:hypothetical protein
MPIVKIALTFMAQLNAHRKAAIGGNTAIPVLPGYYLLSFRFAQDVAHADRSYNTSCRNQRPRLLLSLVGFEVTLIGRFRVTLEGNRSSGGCELRQDNAGADTNFDRCSSTPASRVLHQIRHRG